jgi:hypothetical protein
VVINRPSVFLTKNSACIFHLSSHSNSSFMTCKCTEGTGTVQTTDCSQCTIGTGTVQAADCSQCTVGTGTVQTADCSQCTVGTGTVQTADCSQCTAMQAAPAAHERNLLQSFSCCP